MTYARTIAKRLWCRINNDGRERVPRRPNGSDISTSRRSTSGTTCPRACRPRRWPCPSDGCRSPWSDRPRRKTGIRSCRVSSWPAGTTKNKNKTYTLYITRRAELRGRIVRKHRGKNVRRFRPSTADTGGTRSSCFYNCRSTIERIAWVSLRTANSSARSSRNTVTGNQVVCR